MTIQRGGGGGEMNPYPLQIRPLSNHIPSPPPLTVLFKMQVLEEGWGGGSEGMGDKGRKGDHHKMIYLN